MKYLITGGCGFLGSNIAFAILQKQLGEVLVFDNLSRLGSDKNLYWLKTIGPVKFVQGDTANFTFLGETVKAYRPDIIFHLAGQVAMTTSIQNPRLDFDTNVLGGFNILESVRQFCPNAGVIFSSTNKVFGDLEQFHYKETESRYECIEYPDGFKENVGLDFHSPYGCSKGATDQYMLDYHRIFKLKTAVFRHSSMYGSRQFGTFDQGWISWFCQKALETKKNPNTTFTISGTGKQVRDVLHAKDMVNLYLTAAENIDEIQGQAFNIGGGKENSLSLLELFALLEKLLDVKLNYTKLPPRESDQKVFIADISKANKILGWQPEVSKEEGIREILSWLEKGME